MPITLNKRKDFKKTNETRSSRSKAQDETVQITRKEWESMQESLAQLQTFMNDLVEGNLEIEIVDDGKEEKPEKEEEVEEVTATEEVKEEPKEEPKDKVEEKVEEKVDEEKGEDADMEEVLKDPAKRKAVLEYLKATDSIHPIKDLSLSKIRKRVNTLVKKEGVEEAEQSKAINSIMDQIKKHRKDGKPIDVTLLTKVANKVLGSVPQAKAKDAVQPIKRKTIKKSMDKAIPDFTSRFEDNKPKAKAVDNKKKDLSKEFSNRFN